MTKVKKLITELRERIIAIETRQEKLQKRHHELSEMLDKYDGEESIEEE